MNQELIYPMILEVFRDVVRTGLNMMWDAIEALVYMYGDRDKEINQCDGCRRGLPLKDGVHCGEGYDMIVCTKERYSRSGFPNRDRYGIGGC